MNIKEKKLIVTFLHAASDSLSNNGCNDWQYPKDWTEDEKRELVKGFHDHNGDPEEFDPNMLNMQDDCIASYLGHKLQAEIESDKKLSYNYFQDDGEIVFLVNNKRFTSWSCEGPDQVDDCFDEFRKVYGAGNS